MMAEIRYKRGWLSATAPCLKMMLQGEQGLMQRLAITLVLAAILWGIASMVTGAVQVIRSCT